MKKTVFVFIIIILIVLTLPLRTLDIWMPTDVRLDTGDTAGASSSSQPKIACSGNYVYSTWTDKRNGEADVYFNYSDDNGVNWLPSSLRLDTGDTAGDSLSGDAEIACTGNYVYVAWFDMRDGNPDIYFNYSSDNGQNWQSTDTRLDTGDTAGANDSVNPKIACCGNSVYVLWQDLRNGSAFDVYFNYSTDNGVNWQSSAIRLDTGDTAGANDSWHPQIACSGNYVYAVWEDDRNGQKDIYFNYSSNSGASWLSAPFRLDTDTAGAQTSHDPQIVCSGNHVYAIWGDNRNGGYNIYFNYSTDNGANWQVSDVRLNTGDDPDNDDCAWPQIAVTGQYVYVAWQSYYSGWCDIYFNYSTDYGVNWQSSVIRLDTGDAPGTTQSQYVQIASSGNSVHAAWVDLRNGSDDIYTNYSTDNGVNWQASDIRLDKGDAAGANGSYNPRIAGSDNNLYAVWSDKRDGYQDIYFNRVMPWADIQANGSDDPISISQSDTLQIRVSLKSNGSIESVDYWLAYKGPSGWVHYNNSTKKWESGLGVTHQGPLMNLNNKKVFQKSGLAPGNYTFYFGVDLNMNGKVTKSLLYKDEVKVTVTSD